MFTFSNSISVFTLLVTALMAGLFYSYSFSVNPGLAPLDDKSYLLAMQSINRAILNPIFFICFFGSVALLPLNAYLGYEGNITLKFSFLALAAAFYIIGLFGITILYNVPLNESLGAFKIEGSSAEQLSDMRKAFEGPWNRWHSIRTGAVIISFILLAIGSVLPKST
ncbi:Cytochrome c class I [Flavobacterium beibuense]|uniref:Cytochrome c class I n=2 Tax=Flavobacterium beibuense TaxID=657326 RepID=A0A444WIX1_9FLAO|nr:Cytochrome c class I [Flavobacterium beibuense]